MSAQTIAPDGIPSFMLALNRRFAMIAKVLISENRRFTPPANYSLTDRSGYYVLQIADAIHLLRSIRYGKSLLESVFHPVHQWLARPPSPKRKYCVASLIWTFPWAKG